MSSIRYVILRDNSLRPRSSRRHFADDMFKCISVIENVSNPIQISLKFVPRGPINTLRPRKIGRHVLDDIFKCIFLNEKVWISMKISLKFIPKGPINNIPALVQIMAWRRPGDKPLSETMHDSFLTHICVTRSQWVNNIPALVQITAWRRPGDMPLSEPMMDSLPTHICVTRPQWFNEKHSTFLQILVKVGRSEKGNTCIICCAVNINGRPIQHRFLDGCRKICPFLCSVSSNNIPHESLGISWMTNRNRQKSLKSDGTGMNVNETYGKYMKFVTNQNADTEYQGKRILSTATFSESTLLQYWLRPTLTTPLIHHKLWYWYLRLLGKERRP